jgi:hypothetical protein
MPRFGPLHVTITYIFDLLFSISCIVNTELSVTDDRYREAAVENSIHALPHISYQPILKVIFNSDILSICYENLTGKKSHNKLHKQRYSIKKAFTLRHILITYLIKCDKVIRTYRAILKVQGIIIICTSTTLYELHYQIFNKTENLRAAVIL